jgi:hypothetical protein
LVVVNAPDVQAAILASADSRFSALFGGAPRPHYLFIRENLETERQTANGEYNTRVFSIDWEQPAANLDNAGKLTGRLAESGGQSPQYGTARIHDCLTLAAYSTQASFALKNNTGPLFPADVLAGVNLVTMRDTPIINAIAADVQKGTGFLASTPPNNLRLIGTTQGLEQLVTASGVPTAYRSALRCIANGVWSDAGEKYQTTGGLIGALSCK